MAGASEASELLAKDYSRYSINSMNCVENDQWPNGSYESHSRTYSPLADGLRVAERAFEGEPNPREGAKKGPEHIDIEEKANENRESPIQAALPTRLKSGSPSFEQASGTKSRMKASKECKPLAR
uniref:Uncharacterized protein n=1 Tax=Populus alba TaxID=43335 RepID=A0A4U5Q1Y3_POPAL|nr:hypothetical protein D5086_0000160280 [Populus alba]